MGALASTSRRPLAAIVAVLLAGLVSGCGTKTEKAKGAFPNDDATGKCVESWNKRASPDDQATLASNAQVNATTAALVRATGADPRLQTLGPCMVVQMGDANRPNVAFTEDSGGGWIGSSPGNPTDYESGSPLGTVLEAATAYPNASIGRDGQITLNYPYSISVK